MKTTTRTEVTILKTEIKVTHYDDFVLLEYGGTGWADNLRDYLVVTNKTFNRVTNKGKKNLLPENFSLEDNIERYTEKYLTQYYEGNWCPRFDEKTSWILNPKRYLQRGDFYNFYMGYASDDGFLRYPDGSIVSRKIRCEFWEEDYDVESLRIEFKKHSQFSSIRINNDICPPNIDIVGDCKLVALYEPKPGKLDQWYEEEQMAYVGGSCGVIHRLAYINKHRKPLDN